MGLCLKTVSVDSNPTTERVAERIKLPLGVAEQLLQHLYREKLVEIRGLAGIHNHRYAMLERGWERVRRIFETNGYVGSAPVSLNAYTSSIVEQARGRDSISPDSVRAALSHLVLPESVVQTLGLVVNSRRSLFITGPPGNGKTTMARALHAARGGDIWIPYAVEVDGQVIRTYDVHNHELVDPLAGIRYDQRWVRIKRPLVIVGGELTIESMDLIFSPFRFYEAPFQLKANGGTLVIDDFGRQRVNPRDLMNRWIIPFENRVDYLTLHTGKKIEVPFENQLVFATNLDPGRIVDDAFLRRIGYRLMVDRPSRETYSRIFESVVRSRELNDGPELLDTLFKLYDRDHRPLAACEPRDLIDRCLDICRFEERPPRITPELLELAWTNYFGQTSLK